MKKKLWLVSIIVFLILAVLGYNYVYQDHRNISNESADFTINSKTLSEAFKNNIKDAETKYLNKAIVVIGEISEMNESNITLDDAVFLDFSSKINTSELKQNTPITIKGRCIGYDDLLEQVKLDQCTITN